MFGVGGKRRAHARIREGGARAVIVPHVNAFCRRLVTRGCVMLREGVAMEVQVGFDDGSGFE